MNLYTRDELLGRMFAINVDNGLRGGKKRSMKQRHLARIQPYGV